MMRKTMQQTALLLAIVFFTQTRLWAQESTAEDKLSVGISLNHDAFFGFNPSLAFAYEMNPKTALTFYGIQWGAGTASAWGNWTEFGFGVNFKTGIFDINPQLGFTMGSLLSSGAAQRGVVGDGIVPNLTVNMENDKFIGQLYSGYYAAFRNETKPGEYTNNYMHYWVNAGVKATPWFAVGAHFENLYLASGKLNTNGNGDGGDLTKLDGFNWIGPFMQVSKGDAGMRFSFGADLTKKETSFSMNDFYKLQLFFGF
jgi:hypothetical protein